MKNWIIMTFGGLMIYSAVAMANVDQSAQKIEAIIEEDIAATEEPIGEDTQEVEEIGERTEKDLENVYDLEGSYVPSGMSDLSTLAAQMPTDINLREFYSMIPSSTA